MDYRTICHRRNSDHWRLGALNAVSVDEVDGYDPYMVDKSTVEQ